MEGLLYCARNSFQDPFITFQDEPGGEVFQLAASERPYDTVDIRTAKVGLASPKSTLTEPKVSYRRSLRRGSELHDFMSQDRWGQKVPQLKLVSISGPFSAESGGSLSINISRSRFDCLFAKLNAHPWSLWLLSSKYDGCHHMKEQEGFAETFFFGDYNGALIWTFDPASACTRAILISRSPVHFNRFHALLNTNSSHLYTPYVPLMAIVLDAILTHEKQLDQYTLDIIQVENGTGFSWTGPDSADFRFQVNELAKWSRVSASIQINVINLLRHHENCMQALKLIQDINSNGIAKSPNKEYEVEFNQSVANILESIKILRMRAEAFVPYATYVKNRVEAQINVIFALLTHEDSTSNLKVAEASTAVAVATKRDSSAMKTIAFMTMAFLPATFFAAFFAIPVLEWESKVDVRMNGFQLYWIVTIPATILVFVLWAVITQWGWIVRKTTRRCVGKSRSQEKP